MISWIVASHRDDILSSVLLPSLAGVEDQGDEVIVIRDAPSITLAYAAGQARATQPVRCYIHHDVRVLAPRNLRDQLVTWAGDDTGMVGVIGARTLAMPWWPTDEHGVTDQLGSVMDTWWGRLDWGTGGPCGVLDGMLLATRQRVAWDVEAPGWHGYDADACAQMTARGLTNWCLTGGWELVEHVREGKPGGEAANPGWSAAVQRFRSRWLGESKS